MTIQITPSQLKVFRTTARKREAALIIRLEARRQRAWVIAQQAAVILKEEFSTSRVVVFGSILQPDRFHLTSDIDLAVWNIQDYFRAVARFMDLDPEIDFDLVPIEDAYPRFLAAINQDRLDL